jgi:DNA polymerase-3 subunit delta'
MTAPYPWFTRQWNDLQGVVESGRLGHALLFSGRESVGVEDLASAFARQMLCEASSDMPRPCHSCRGCSLFRSGNHPDFKTLNPAEEGKAILIDQVRELAEFYTLKSHYGRAKIAFIYPADAMNRAAANAILKILEEPPSNALFLLVAHRFSAISITVRSRCVRIPCEQISTVAATQWLKQEIPDADDKLIGSLLGESGGAPLKARKIVADEGPHRKPDLLNAFAEVQAGQTHALTQAKIFADIPARELLRILITMTNRLILAKFGCPSFYDRANDALDPSLQGLADHLNLKHLYRFLDLLFESKALLAQHSGFREADITEALWLGLADAVLSRAAKEG